MKKIAICGSSKYNSDNESKVCKIIGEGLGKLSRSLDLVLATGGSAGIPPLIVQEAKKINPNLILEAYTPCKNAEEWNSYLQTGLVPPCQIFDKIIYTELEERIELRALQRITKLLDLSYGSIFYLNSNAGNTYVELFSANGLKIPSFILTLDDKIKEAVASLTKGTRIYSDPKKLTTDLADLLLK